MFYGLNVCSSLNSKVNRRLLQRRAAARKAKSPNPEWRSSSITSTFRRTRSMRQVKSPWTRRMLGSCSSSSSSSSCRSSASNSSITTIRPFYQHLSSMHGRYCATSLLLFSSTYDVKMSSKSKVMLGLSGITTFSLSVDLWQKVRVALTACRPPSWCLCLPHRPHHLFLWLHLQLVQTTRSQTANQEYCLPTWRRWRYQENPAFWHWIVKL